MQGALESQRRALGKLDIQEGPSEMQQNRAAEPDEQARMERMQAGDAASQASESKHVRTREGWVFLATRGYADEDDDVSRDKLECLVNVSIKSSSHDRFCLILIVLHVFHSFQASALKIGH